LPNPSPVLEAINLELRELEATAASLRDLDEEEPGLTRRLRLCERRCGR
jgi:hypothetical protein